MEADPSGVSLGVPLLGALALGCIHLAAGWLHRRAEARPRWLSAASGVSVAYVFVHLLPDLSEAEARWLEARPHRPFQWLEHQVYLMALLGVVVALGLARVTSGHGQRKARFWLQLGSAAVYNLLIGGLAFGLSGLASLVLAVLAFGAHLLINDYHLHVQYGRLYARTGRCLLAVAPLLGWYLEARWGPPGVVDSALLGLVAGGIILNVINEELPEPHQGRFSVFLAGTVLYSALLLSLAYSQHAGASPRALGPAASSRWMGMGVSSCARPVPAGCRD